MESRPKCEYCGCSSIDCLAQCASTNLYFCNGKGLTYKSHIIHHLQSINEDTINLPKENQFHSTEFKCYICGSTNIFKLGFVQSKNNDKLFIVCRSPCQLDESLRDQIDHDNFTPIVSNNEIFSQIVRVPNEDEYQKISIAKTIEVRDQAFQILKGSDSQGINSEDQQIKAQLKYDSVQDYVSLMKTFVDSELATLEQENNRRYGMIKFTWESPTTVTFRAHPQLFKSATVGCSLKVTCGDTEETAIVTKRLNTMHITARFSGNSSLFGTETGITVQVIVSNIPFKRQKIALDLLMQRYPPLHWLILEMFLGNIEKLSRHNKLKRQKLSFFQPESGDFPLLNEYQQKSVSFALNNRFSLIQGPPGTGKTTVIAALAYSFVRNGIKPVLICAQSNVSADFATVRLSQTGLGVVRVLSSRAEITSEIEPFTARAKASKKFGSSYDSLVAGNPSENDDVRWQIYDLESQIVEESDAVCTTCVSAGGSLLRDKCFKVVIFDESGQCLDPDLLIGLSHRAEQAILVGDHKQLGPMVQSRVANRGRYNLPLMSRLIIIGVHPIVLRIQYRMHSAISCFPSALFYDNLIKNGLDDTNDRRFNGKDSIEIFPWPNPNCPILFWNVLSEEHNYDSAMSYINETECGCINQILTRLHQNGVTASDIGIITPYTGQQTYLIDTLPRISEIDDDDFFDNLEISSVDAFQGREKNFIILSCVRANKGYEIGFLKDKKRLCVSLTRAKFGIFILGNAETFARNHTWSSLIEKYRSVNAFVAGESIDNLKPASFTPLSANMDEDDNIAESNEEEFGIA